MNNSSDDIVCQFSYGRFNGAIHLLIQFVVVEVFKCKSKMSALPVNVDKGEGAVRDLAKNQWDRSAIGRNLQVYKVIAAVRDGLLAI